MNVLINAFNCIYDNMTQNSSDNLHSIHQLAAWLSGALQRITLRLQGQSSKVKVMCTNKRMLLASCLIYARALLEYVIFIMWLCSVIKMLRSAKFAEDKVLTFLILHQKC